MCLCSVSLPPGLNEGFENILPPALMEPCNSAPITFLFGISPGPLHTKNYTLALATPKALSSRILSSLPAFDEPPLRLLPHSHPDTRAHAFCLLTSGFPVLL